MSRTLLLDLDGTLVDSVPDLAPALNRLMTSRGLGPFAHPEVAAMVGDGVRALVQKAFAARGLAADETAIASFANDYAAHVADQTRAFPGVEATLGKMQSDGWRLAVCTNKPEATARRLLAALGLDGFFAAVGGGDSFAVRKPDPAHLLATLSAAGGQLGRALMAGDHRNDVLAATGAGLPCIFAAWGYAERASAEGAAVVAERFSDLAGIAEQLLAE